MSSNNHPEPGRDRKTERKRRSHAAILASATRLVREGGIRATSVADVMRGAGMTVGGFYAHFPSKEALFAESIASAATDAWERFLATLPEGEPHERARAALRGYLSRAHRDLPESGCPLPAVAAEAAR
ncbi:MAG: TetR/AcrR family transcriptional regulator, partial [Deltaproteobacteria bacterium]